MKVHSSLALTLLLLSLMLAVGIVSGAAGYTFGRKALRGITQPAINPIPVGPAQGNKLPQQGSTLLQERDILAKVEAQIKGITKNPAKAAAASPTPKASPQASPQAKPQAKKTPAPAAAFPISSQDKGVKLEVRSLTVQGDGLVMEVALKNEGATPVQFLYTFLDVTDEQGRVLTAETSGLPTELQPHSDTFSGTIKILDTAALQPQQLSLSLTNYPEQDLQLSITKIPVVR